MTTRKFWKMSGAGNDFVLIEGPARGAAALARRLCDRRRSIGADGLLIVSRAGLRLRYVNADGSETFCGNGSRCAAVWAASRGWASGREFAFETSAGPLSARLTSRGRAAIAMPTPKLLRETFPVSAEGRRWLVSHWDTGVPHAVARVPNVETVPVVAAGRALRQHRAFGRAGANVDFVAVEAAGRRLRLRTYERGVEDETLACGTGVVAAAAAAQAFGWARLPLAVVVRGGDTLRVSREQGRTWLEGPAKITFTGDVTL
jgi:diaminopimelate epimerase